MIRGVKRLRGCFAERAALASIGSLALMPAFLAGCADTATTRVATGVARKARFSSPAPSGLRAAPTDALSLWKRTLLASRATPGVASVIETHFGGNGSDHDVTQFSVVESEIDRRGQIARYRLTYTAPGSMKGVVILNDGRHVWRYNAQKRLVARQASVTAPLPPELEEGVASVPVQLDGAHPEIEGGLERVAGRSTQVLAIRTRRSGRIVERRWVDRDTGRTLRLEQYAGRDAHIVRRVEVTGFRPFTASHDVEWASRQFTPTFPETARVVDAGSSHARHIAEAEDVARRADLPLHVRGFALRSVERSTNASIEPLPDSSAKAIIRQHDRASARSVPTHAGARSDVTASASVMLSARTPGLDSMTQFYYRKGNQAISIFTSTLPVSRRGRQAKAGAITPRPSFVARPGWRQATLSGGEPGYTCELARGAAVAWTGTAGGAYVAVSRMPLTELMPIVQAFAANRDDAPAASISARL